MLAADKLQLQSSLKQQATALKEKEFNLHHSNLMTVGTQAAVLASLDVTMFIEFQPPANSEWGELTMIPRTLKFFYYIAMTIAFCSNILVVSQTTMLSLYGSSLALRGPDGSMIIATDGLYEERKTVFNAFSVGLASTVGSVVLVVWLMLTPESAIVCMSITIFTGFKIYSQYLRVVNRFEFDESETVDFADIFDGPAAIMAVPLKWRGNGDKNSINNGRSNHEMNGSERETTDRSSFHADEMMHTQNTQNNRGGRRIIRQPRDPIESDYAGNDQRSHRMPSNRSNSSMAVV